MKTYEELKVGEKMWTIQLGDCEITCLISKNVYDKRFPLELKNNEGVITYYTKDYKYNIDDFHRSVFESNPFFEERQMLVSDDNIDWYKRTVVFHRNDKYVAIDANNKDLFIWDYAKEIEKEETPEEKVIRLENEVKQLRNKINKDHGKAI